MRQLVLHAITFYQRRISPRKGFCCAYHAHTGRRSCSGLGFRAVRRYGAFTGLAVLKRRMHLCGVAHRRYSALRSGTLHRQRGVCDFSCDLPCDLPSFDGFGDALDCCDCAGGCDWPGGGRRRGDDKEKYVYIPPNSM